MRPRPGSQRRRSLALLISISAHVLLVAALAEIDWSRTEVAAGPLPIVWIAAPPPEFRDPTIAEPPDQPPSPQPAETPASPPAEPAPEPSPEPPPEPSAAESTEESPVAPTLDEAARTDESDATVADRDSELTAPESPAAEQAPGPGITWQVLEDTREEVIAEMRREQARERSYRYLGRWRAADPPLLSPAPQRFESAARERAGLAMTEPDGTLIRWISDNCYAMVRPPDPGTPYVLRSMPAPILCSGRNESPSNLFEGIRPAYLDALPPERSGSSLPLEAPDALGAAESPTPTNAADIRD